MSPPRLTRHSAVLEGKWAQAQPEEMGVLGRAECEKMETRVKDGWGG